MTTQTSTLEKIEIALPKKYKVILKDNGDGSPINGKSAFIRDLLILAFTVTPASAVQLLRKLDRDKMVVIGIYSKQIAETMLKKANEYINEPHNKVFNIEAKIEQA